MARHREIWADRPELRWVYHSWFDELLQQVAGRQPVVEVGGGPGFFKEYYPQLISTDVTGAPWLDVACDACVLPFRSESIGALVMVDVLHHLERPLDFLTEAARVLRPGGRLAVIEPWLTPLSYLIYRFLHHERCEAEIDLASPFGPAQEDAWDGNAAIPFRLVQHVNANQSLESLRMIVLRAFMALPYLLSFGFKCSRRLPLAWVQAGGTLEPLARPLVRWTATRALVVWEKSARDTDRMGVQS